MKKLFYILLLILGISAKSQITLHVKELNYEENKHYIPKNWFANDLEKKYTGHILEITIANISTKSISLPIDTLSYALPYTSEAKKFYKGLENIPPNPDLFNNLGVYGFVYQNKSFVSSDIAPDPYWESGQLDENSKVINKRQEKIEKHKKNKNLNKDLEAIYNLYLNENMIVIEPKKTFTYKLYFNPFLKMLHNYSYREYYFRLSSKIPYDVTFKLIFNNNLYRFLTKEDKKKYKNLFVGIINSNILKITTENKK